jgi:hypothetical protein
MYEVAAQVSMPPAWVAAMTSAGDGRRGRQPGTRSPRGALHEKGNGRPRVPGPRADAIPREVELSAHGDVVDARRGERVDQRSPAKRSFSGTAVPVASLTRTKVSVPISSPNLSLPILRKKMFSP